jgi:hypothetical protein
MCCTYAVSRPAVSRVFMRAKLLVMSIVTVASATDLAMAQRAASQPQPSQAESAEREAVLDSLQWRATMHGLDAWLGAQKLYDGRRAQRMKADLLLRVSKMQAAELQTLLADMQEKLAILSSSEFHQAESSLTQYLSRASAAKAEQILREFPDISRLSAADFKTRLKEFQDRQASARQSQLAFDRGREAQLVQMELSARAARAEPQGSRGPVASPPARQEPRDVFRHVAPGPVSSSPSSNIFNNMFLPGIGYYPGYGVKR